MATNLGLRFIRIIAEAYRPKMSLGKYVLSQGR
jgi:hypothetical protein